MAKFEFRGSDKYLADLRKLGGKNARAVIKYAVYPGAGIVADAIKQEIVANHSSSGDLADSMELTVMQTEDGFTYTQIRFPGYDKKGVPNQLKANVLESGSRDKSRPATHFLSRTVRRVRDEAEKAMADALDEKIGQIMGD